MCAGDAASSSKKEGPTPASFLFCVVRVLAVVRCGCRAEFGDPTKARNGNDTGTHAHTHKQGFPGKKTVVLSTVSRDSKLFFCERFEVG